MGEHPVGRRRVGGVEVALDPEAALAVEQLGAAVGRQRRERRLEELGGGGVDVAGNRPQALLAPFVPDAALAAV